MSLSEGSDVMRTTKTRILFIAATVLGLIMLESPIILLANRAEPTVLGFPFLLAWVLFWWAFCTAVFLVAHLMNWGKPRNRAVAEGREHA